MRLIVNQCKQQPYKVDSFHNIHRDSNFKIPFLYIFMHTFYYAKIFEYIRMKLKIRLIYEMWLKCK